jgi:putative oxidoreductase
MLKPCPIRNTITLLLTPIIDFLLRLVVAYPFFLSGLTKWTYVKNDQLDTLYFLFEDYNVPFLPVNIAALMATAGELILPILLTFGIVTRLGALGLLVMTAVIYNADGNAHAVYWAVITAYFVIHGAGKISVDNLVLRRYLPFV